MNKAPDSSIIDNLCDALRCLPGVGPKSAQRMAFHLLQRARPQGKLLAQALSSAMDKVIHCQRCNTFSQTSLCRICDDEKRDKSVLCIVENPNDLIAIEQTHGYQGCYFVLMGRLSPLDGIGPADIGIDKLMDLLRSESIKEVIFAINPNMEGEATLYYLSQLMNPLNLKLSQLAHGVPVGTELEFLDSKTIKRAMKERNAIEA